MKLISAFCLHRTFTPDTLSPDQNNPTMTVQSMQKSVPRNVGTGSLTTTSATPTVQQRMKAIGVATPLAMSSPVRR